MLFFLRPGYAPPWLTGFIVVLSMCLSRPAGAGDRLIFERWYAVMLEDRHVGWMHATEHRSNGQPHAPPTITTRSTMKVVVRRGDIKIKLLVASSFIETSGGRPIIARSQQKLGLAEVTHVVRFQRDQVEVVTRQHDREQRRTLPYPRVPDDRSNPSSGAGWLTPAGAQRHLQEQLAADAKEIRYWLMDPSMGLDPFEVHLTVHGRENLAVLGKVVPATVCDVVVSKLPGVSTREYLDPNGRSVRSTVSAGPGMTFSVIEADRQLATAKINPPELMAKTLIKPDRAITQPRQLRSATYDLVLTPNDDRSKQDAPAIPNSSFQQVKWLNPQTARVAVDLDHPKPAPNDLPGMEHITATTMLDADDPEIQELTTRALADEPPAGPPLEKALALRRFVHSYIQAKDLSVGLATASEVARTRQGDCTEHAVLLAAMLRCANIPSRVVSGLIYVDRFMNESDVFGYHMWSQAWVAGPAGKQGRWVDLDAVLNDVPFDAAHIALTTSTMSDHGLTNDLVALAPLIGRLKIKVVGAP